MIREKLDYTLFMSLFNNISREGFELGDQGDPLMNELDRIMKTNSQFLCMGDGILLDMFFVSAGANDFYDIDLEKISFGMFLKTTHPDDLERRKLVRSRIVVMGHELFKQKTGHRVISVNFRCKIRSGEYRDILHQLLLFYSELPYESVFIIMVQTDISDYKKIHRDFHLYIGDDKRYFRCPDDELLMLGSKYSAAEIKIIELINEGLTTKEIAQKLFRSHFTISTHRTNIIKKSGKQTLIEVISELKEQTLL